MRLGAVVCRFANTLCSVATAEQQKTPGSFPPGAYGQTSMIRRSGIEVAVDAEADRDVVDVVCWRIDRAAVGYNRTPERSGAVVSAADPLAEVAAFHIKVHHVHAHVEVLGDVPLGA